MAAYSSTASDDNSPNPIEASVRWDASFCFQRGEHRVFASELVRIGFALGSLAGSSTTLANFELDWFRVESGTSDVNSVWETVPEPGTLTLLVLGGALLVARRRR
jgi:hypothetical protein